MVGLNGLRTVSHNKGDSDDERILLQWREDSCVLCSTKCLVLDGPENSGKVPTADLLSLLDTAIDEGPDAVTVCVSCSSSVGKLQVIFGQITRLQSTFKSFQGEIVSKVLQSEELPKGNIFDNAVRKGLFKRWKPESPNEDSSPGESLVDIPFDLIISPATPSAEEDQEEIQQSSQNDHEIQFHLDPNDFEDTDMKNTGSEENRIGSVPPRDVECIDVDDSDEEQEEVDAANLIPAIEINTFSENEERSVDFNHVQWDNSPPAGNSSSMVVQDLNAFLAQNHGALPIQDFFFTNGDLFNNELNVLIPPNAVLLPVGRPALSPVYGQGGGRAKAVRRVKRKSRSSSGTSKIPVFSCTVCTEQFNSRDKFKEHLESHNGKAPTCDICQKVFPRKHNLMIHMRTHTGEKPYDCPVCHKPYSDRSNFNAHVRKHMEKPFACTVCGRMFYNSRAANVHVTSLHPEKAAEKTISKVTFKP